MKDRNCQKYDMFMFPDPFPTPLPVRQAIHFFPWNTLPSVHQQRVEAVSLRLSTSKTDGPQEMRRNRQRRLKRERERKMEADNSSFIPYVCSTKAKATKWCEKSFPTSFVKEERVRNSYFPFILQRRTLSNTKQMPLGGFFVHTPPVSYAYVRLYYCLVPKTEYELWARWYGRVYIQNSYIALSGNE